MASVWSLVSKKSNEYSQVKGQWAEEEKKGIFYVLSWQVGGSPDQFP